MCTHDAVHLRHGQLQDRGELLHVVAIPRAVLLPLRQPQPQSRRGHPHHGHWQRLRWIVCELRLQGSNICSFSHNSSSCRIATAAARNRLRFCNRHRGHESVFALRQIPRRLRGKKKRRVARKVVQSRLYHRSGRRVFIPSNIHYLVIRLSLVIHTHQGVVRIFRNCAPAARPLILSVHALCWTQRPLLRPLS